jgi:three-Cys-motif partner protein
MSGRSAAPIGQLLDAPKLPQHEPHHVAKHGLLREYANAWLPKLGFTFPQTAVIDGFASAGRYRDGNVGSPLLLLHAYVGRSDHALFKAPPHFVFIEPRLEFAKHLQAEVDALPDLAGAKVDVIHGRYDEEFPRVIHHLEKSFPKPLPVFAFIDPRGYKDPV